MWKQSISLSDNRVKWITSNSKTEAAVQSAGVVDEDGDGVADAGDVDAATTAASLSIGWVRAFANERDPNDFTLEWRPADIGYIIVRVEIGGQVVGAQVGLVRVH